MNRKRVVVQDPTSGLTRIPTGTSFRETVNSKHFESSCTGDTGRRGPCDVERLVCTLPHTG